MTRKECSVRREALKILALLVLTGLLAGCGFQLRGAAQLPFASAHIVGQTGSVLKERLTRYLSTSGKQLTAQGSAAEVVIRLDQEARGKDILALSGGGKVREYRLRHEVVLSVQDSLGRELLPPTPITTTRDMSYSDEQVLGKESEEATLFRDMEQDILRQIQRQLAYIRR